MKHDPRVSILVPEPFHLREGVADLTEALQSADATAFAEKFRRSASPRRRTKAQELALQLARWGVTRVCPLGQMQNPPLTWRHDGRPALGDLVTWTDWET